MESLVDNDKPLFTIKKWHAVACWTCACGIENCAICQQFLSTPVIQCHVIDEDHHDVRTRSVQRSGQRGKQQREQQSGIHGVVVADFLLAFAFGFAALALAAALGG